MGGDGTFCKLHMAQWLYFQLNKWRGKKKKIDSKLFLFPFLTEVNNTKLMKGKYAELRYFGAKDFEIRVFNVRFLWAVWRPQYCSEQGGEYKVSFIIFSPIMS